MKKTKKGERLQAYKDFFEKEMEHMSCQQKLYFLLCEVALNRVWVEDRHFHKKKKGCCHEED